MRVNQDDSDCMKAIHQGHLFLPYRESGGEGGSVYVQGFDTDIRVLVLAILPNGLLCVFTFPSGLCLMVPTWLPKHQPGTVDPKQEVREQGTKGRSPHVLVPYQGGNIFPEASSGLLLVSHGHPLASHRQMMIRMS